MVRESAIFGNQMPRARKLIPKNLIEFDRARKLVPIRYQRFVNPFRTQEMHFLKKKNPKYFLRRLAHARRSF